MKKPQMKKMIQDRVNLLIKDSQPSNIPFPEWRCMRKKIEELDWVLSLFEA